MQVSAVRQAVADAVAVIGEIQSTPHIPGSIAPPSFFVESALITYDETASGSLDQLEVRGVLLVSMGDRQSGQEALDPYLDSVGAQSVRQAIETARRTCAFDMRLALAEGPLVLAVAGIEYWGARFTVQVWA